MGFREWVFRVETTADIRALMKIVKEHNEAPEDVEAGDPLCVAALVRCKNPKYPTCYYIPVCNSGGEPSVWKFLEGKYPIDKITGPFDKIPRDKTNKYKVLWNTKDEDRDHMVSPFDGKKVRVPRMPEFSDEE